MGKIYITDGKYLIAKIECQDGLEQHYTCDHGHTIVAGEPPEGMRPPPIPHEDGYDKKRLAAYPPIADFADAWVKGDDAALEVYREKCLAVKAKFPKPSN